MSTTLNDPAQRDANMDDAPQSDITLAGNGAIYGQIIGKSVTMTGSSDIYYDLSLQGGNNVIQVVK